MKKLLITFFAFTIILSSFNFSFAEDATSTETYGWTAQIEAGKKNWKLITSSADGTKLVAATAYGGYGSIYTSTDSGATWVEQQSAGSRNWSSITSSSDGSKLAAVADYGSYVYISTDSGATWTTATSSGERNWLSITSSADGTKLAAVVNDGYIYTSNDSGATWATSTAAGSRRWSSIISSSDGTRLVAAINTTNFVYISTDSGVTWTSKMTPTSFGTLSASGDGMKIAAIKAYSPYNAYLSLDGGNTWTEQVGLSLGYGSSVKFSSDGTKLFAIPRDGSFTKSTIDNGITWVDETSLGPTYWQNLAVSSDGTKIVAIDEWGLKNYEGGYIYTSHVPIKKPILISGFARSINNRSLDIPFYINTPHTKRGVEYCSTGLVQTQCEYTDLVEDVGDFTQENITIILTDLEINSYYNYRFFAENSAGRTYSENYIKFISSIDWNYIPNTDNMNWEQITVSDDGQFLLLTETYGYTFISSDGGDTWATTSLPSEWHSGIASSADGKYLAVSGNYLHLSSDYGKTWTQVSEEKVQLDSEPGVHMSKDGKHLVVAAYNGYVQYSHDYGETWEKAETLGTKKWSSVIIASPNGMKIVALDGYGQGYMHISSDGGNTWIKNENIGEKSWSIEPGAITSSADGQKLAVVEWDGYIYISEDGGDTWDAKGSIYKRWSAVAMSADGIKLTAVDNYGYVFRSLDGGNTWIHQESLPLTAAWQSVASSASGEHVFVVAYDGTSIYRYFNRLPKAQNVKAIISE